MFEIVSAPAAGRVFDGAATIRLGDSSPGGRARFDAIARHLQDLSDDDARAAGFGAYSWVVRRTAIAVHAFPTQTCDVDGAVRCGAVHLRRSWPTASRAALG